MSTTWVLSKLPQRNVNCFAAPLHSAAADRIAHTLCAWRERLGRRDNHDDRFASPAYLPCITACTLVFTHSPTPLAVFCRWRPLHAVQMVIMWMAPLTDQWTTISYRVSRPKKISPDTDTTQYMQISPDNPIAVSFEPYTWPLQCYTGCSGCLFDVRKWVDFKIATFVYCCLSGMALAYLAAVCQLSSWECCHQLRFADSRVLCRQADCSNFGDQCFMVVGLKLWNSLFTGLGKHSKHM